MEIGKLIESADIVRFIKAQRIKWLGHIQRMDRERPTRKLLDWKPMGTKPVGRPRQRWKEDVMEFFKKAEYKKLEGKKKWIEMAEKGKTHKGLYCQVMMMI